MLPPLHCTLHCTALLCTAPPSPTYLYFREKGIILAAAAASIVSCHVCDYACTESGALTKHKRTHTGKKPYA
jgi:hypothetical protein